MTLGHGFVWNLHIEDDEYIYNASADGDDAFVLFVRLLE